MPLEAVRGNEACKLSGTCGAEHETQTGHATNFSRAPPACGGGVRCARAALRVRQLAGPGRGGGLPEAAAEQSSGGRRRALRRTGRRRAETLHLALRAIRRRTGAIARTRLHRIPEPGLHCGREAIPASREAGGRGTGDAGGGAEGRAARRSSRGPGPPRNTFAARWSRERTRASRPGSPTGSRSPPRSAPTTTPPRRTTPRRSSSRPDIPASPRTTCACCSRRGASTMPPGRSRRTRPTYWCEEDGPSSLATRRRKRNASSAPPGAGTSRRRRRGRSRRRRIGAGRVPERRRRTPHRPGRSRTTPCGSIRTADGLALRLYVPGPAPAAPPGRPRRARRLVSVDASGLLFSDCRLARVRGHGRRP